MAKTGIMVRITIRIMKQITGIIFLCTLILAGFACGNNSGAQKNASGQISISDTAVIVFSEYEHDFGKIAAGEKVAAIFTFTNAGKGPLIINSVTTSCGCTASKYSRKPVAPGQSGTIEIVFDSSGYNGPQRKTATVRSNASQPYVLLQIKGEVVQIP